MCKPCSKSLTISKKPSASRGLQALKKHFGSASIDKRGHRFKAGWYVDKVGDDFIIVSKTNCQSLLIFSNKTNVSNDGMDGNENNANVSNRLVINVESSVEDNADVDVNIDVEDNVDVETTVDVNNVGVNVEANEVQAPVVNDFSWVTPQFMEKMFQGMPAIVTLMKNYYLRNRTRGNQSRHTREVQDIFNLHALTANVSSSSMFSGLVGGPSTRQMYRNIKSAVPVDCFVNKQRMQVHFTLFKEFIESLKVMNGIDQDAQVPIQASIDGTPVSGRIGPIIYPGNEWALVGFNHCPTQRVVIPSLEKSDRQPPCYLSDDDKIIYINGVTSLEDLLRSSTLKRATEYVALIILPLLPKTLPYLLALFPKYKFDANGIGVVFR